MLPRVPNPVSGDFLNIANFRQQAAHQQRYYCGGTDTATITFIGYTGGFEEQGEKKGIRGWRVGAKYEEVVFRRPTPRCARLAF